MGIGRRQPGRIGYFQPYAPPGPGFAHRQQHAPGADIECGAELDKFLSLGIGSAGEYRKRDIKPLPTTHWGLLVHVQIVSLKVKLAEITLVAGEVGDWTVRPRRVSPAAVGLFWGIAAFACDRFRC